MDQRLEETQPLFLSLTLEVVAKIYEFRVRDQFRVRDAGKKTLCLKTHFLVQIFLECGRTPLESIDFTENAPTLYKIFLDLRLTGLAGA